MQFWTKHFSEKQAFFSTQSELIEPVLPQAVQLGVLFTTHSLRCTSLWDLLKDTQLVKESGKRRRRKPSTGQDLNPRPPDYQACALRQCYNRSPLQELIPVSSPGKVIEVIFKWWTSQIFEQARNQFWKDGISWEGQWLSENSGKWLLEKRRFARSIK